MSITLKHLSIFSNQGWLSLSGNITLAPDYYPIHSYQNYNISFPNIVLFWIFVFLGLGQDDKLWFLVISFLFLLIWYHFSFFPWNLYSWGIIGYSLCTMFFNLWIWYSLVNTHMLRIFGWKPWRNDIVVFLVHGITTCVILIYPNIDDAVCSSGEIFSSQVSPLGSYCFPLSN